MHLERVAAVFKLVGDLRTFGGKFPGLADRYESGTQRIRQGRRKNEPTRLNPQYYIDMGTVVVFLQSINGSAESCLIFEQRGDVVEKYAGLRKIGYFANQLFKSIHP